MSNRFAHVELSTGNVAAAKEFYTQLFDWAFEEVPFGAGTYTMIGSGGQGVGGMQAATFGDGEVRPAWLPYVEVADVAWTIEKARAAGATIVVEPLAIGANGTIGVFVDPTGAALGVWAPPAASAPEAPKKPKKTDAEKEARKAEKKARKAAEKQAEAARKAEKKAKKAAEKEARKAAEAKAEKKAEKAHDLAGSKDEAKPRAKAAPKRAPAKRAPKKATRPRASEAKRAAKKR
jgi:hypothetical protein